MNASGLRRRHLPLAITAVFATLAPCLPGTAAAAQVDRRFHSQAVGNCQAALPAFETSLRKRPAGIRNEGSSAVFVTCSYTSQGSLAGFSIANPDRIELHMFNGSPDSMLVHCTGVAGILGNERTGYVTRSIGPGAGSGMTARWYRWDYPQSTGLHSSGLFSVSCALPPGGEINHTSVWFTESVPPF